MHFFGTQCSDAAQESASGRLTHVKTIYHYRSLKTFERAVWQSLGSGEGRSNPYPVRGPGAPGTFSKFDDIDAFWPIEDDPFSSVVSQYIGVVLEKSGGPKFPTPQNLLVILRLPLCLTVRRQFSIRERW